MECFGPPVNETAIRDAYGEVVLTSLAQVAKAFSVSYVTIKTSWRPGGMPGDSKNKQWNVADILIWLLKRDAKNSEARGADDFTRRKREAETVAAEAEARIKLTKAEQVEGEYVPLMVVQSILGATANVLRDAILSVPRQLTPMFPKRYAAEWTEEAERLLRNALTVVSEKPLDDFREQMNSKE
jgi:phage terminase Nu1 subunit (DNA packaging protein)